MPQMLLKQLAGPVAFYLAATLVFLPWYIHLISPDGISYMTIAAHYGDGRWAEAINYHWSPFYSWLIAVLLVAGIPALYAAKGVAIAAGIFTLWAFRKLLARFGLDPRVISILLYAAAFMTVAFALLRITPDLITAALLLLYIDCFFDPDYPRSTRQAMLCGVYGALAFLSKGYIFFFVLLHFPVAHLILWLKARDRRAVSQAAIAGLAAFLICCAPWIAAISIKLGKPSVGTTGSFNYRLVGPDVYGYPQYFHLLPPPTEHGTSMWEAPSPDLLPAWNPFQGKREMVHQIRLILRNVGDLSKHFVEVSYLIPAILLLFVAVDLSQNGWRSNRWQMLLAALALYSPGYLLVLVQDRYYWAFDLLLLASGGFLLQRAIESAYFSRNAKLILALVFAGSFLILPARMLINQRGAGKQAAMLGRTLQEHFPEIQGQIASCRNWNESLYVTFHIGQSFYGVTSRTREEDEVTAHLNASYQGPPKEDASGNDAQFSEELRRYGVDYFLAPEGCTIPSGVEGDPEITGGSIPGMKVYRVEY